MQHQSPHVNKDHYFAARNFDLASKVALLPDSALVGAFEIAALTGIAATSIQKPAQRKSIGFPAPRVVGRMNKWPLSVVKAWLQQGVGVEAQPTKHSASPQRGRGRPGRPTLASKLGNQGTGI